LGNREERRQIAEAIRLHTEVVGTRPTGWYTGRCSVNTVRLTAEAGFDWISDTYDDDLPYWIEAGERDQLVIPYTLEANDMRFATAPGYIEGEQFFTYLKDAFDELYREGAEGHAKMMSVGLHCRLIGRPGKIAGLRRFLEYAQSREGVWFPRRIDIARHWAEAHPPVRRARPSQMGKAEFVKAYGGIFEHSAWIAERAFDLELGVAHDTALGLHNALCRMFRSASETERLGVLTAHPDLAGKLAQAKRLTAESTSEQAGAGLDALTDQERETFTRLNGDYVAKHGFDRRIGNDRATEFAEACRQVERIAEFRLKDILP
jgi:OHCU decarboxylase